MLRWLASISPLALLLAGAIPAGAVGWFGAQVKFDLIDRPGIIREATQRADDACTIRVMDAANRATEAERTRQENAVDAAFQSYRRAAEARERLRANETARLETEISNYERTLNALGRSCLLDDADIGVLTGSQPAAPDRSR